MKATLTNAERQARWRKRREENRCELEEIAHMAITSQDDDGTVAYKLVDVPGFKRARAIGDQLKRCPRCHGSGLFRRRSFKECDIRRDRDGNVKHCPGKLIGEAAFPCPVCQPKAYAVASGVALRNEGRYVEALAAALNIMDYDAAGATVLAWGADPRTIKKACEDQGNWTIPMTDIRRLRDRVT